MIIGVWAETFGQHAFITNLIITSLALLGGVFYAAHRLHQPQRTLTQIDPSATSATPPASGHAGIHESSIAAAALLVALIVAGAAFATATRVIGWGWRIKP